MPIQRRSITTLAVALGTALLFAAGCDRFQKDPQQSESGGEVDESFEPAEIRSVKGVAAAEIRTAIEKRLDRARPKPVTERQWGHAKKLYAEFDGQPIWLDDDGLRERRTKTLM